MEQRHSTDRRPPVQQGFTSNTNSSCLQIVVVTPIFGDGNLCVQQYSLSIQAVELYGCRAHGNGNPGNTLMGCPLAVDFAPRAAAASNLELIIGDR